MNRQKVSLGLAAIVIIGSQAIGHTAVIPSTSCSPADVQTAIDGANEGDTVSVPACTTTWTTTVRMVNRAITLQGAGPDQTVITDM
ncbi:MAG: hypothetical protein GY906_36425, partial [bacterium]|nr:hypothetical protein [bacterium]